MMQNEKREVHITSLKKGERKVAESLAKYTLRTGRGGGLIGQITDMGRDMLQGTVFIFAINEVIGLSIPVLWLPIIVVGKKGCEYLLGWFDEKVGFWKIENDYASRRINPFNKELLDTIKRIEEKVERNGNEKKS